MRRLLCVPVLLAAASTALAAGVAGTTPGLVLSPSAWQERITTDPVGAVALAAGSLLWLLLALLALGVLTSLAALLPGATGRLAAVAARVIAPGLVRRAVNACIGVSLAATIVVPGAALASTPRVHGAGPVAVTAPGEVFLGTPLPPLGEPAGEVVETAPASPAPRIAAQAATTQAATTQAAPAARPTAGVTVQPGDTLWSLADRSLGGHADPEAIAATWPTWWAANRAVIGFDPDLLQPGQVLRPPAH